MAQLTSMARRSIFIREDSVELDACRLPAHTKDGCIRDMGGVSKRQEDDANRSSFAIRSIKPDALFVAMNRCQ